MEISIKEFLELLNSGFVLLIGTALIKAIYFLIRLYLNDKRQDEHIEELQEYCGLRERRITDGFRSSSTSTRKGT